MLDKATDSFIKGRLKIKEKRKKEKTPTKVEKEKVKVEKEEAVVEKEEAVVEKEEVKVEKEEAVVEKEEVKVEISSVSNGKEKENFSHMINQYQNSKPLKEGDIVKAKVVQIVKDGVLLDVGTKSEGFMSLTEYQSKSQKVPQMGEEMNVCVIKKNFSGNLLLSKKEADSRFSWEKFSEAFEQGKPLVVRVNKIVKGGLLATLGSLGCFIPASHVSLKRKENLKKYIGNLLKVRVIELNKNSKNIVVSRKFLQLEEKEKRKEKILTSIEEGKIVTGRVSSITKFGVFVDLGGIDGLIHPENLSWGWVKDPHEIVSMGKIVKVKVLKLDKDKSKISLGIKQTKPDPWSTVKEKYPIGSLVEGKVTHLTNFGAFVEIEEGLEGLIHISDLSWDKRISHPKEAVQVEEVVKVKVLDIKDVKKRMALGIKQIQPDPWEKLLQKYHVGDTIPGVVQEITNFGVFVKLAPGIDGLIHISELDSEYVHHPNKVTSVGEKVNAEIVEIDREKRRIRLSVRQLKEKNNQKENKVNTLTSDDEKIVMGDFIEEKIKEKLRQGFD